MKLLLIVGTLLLIVQSALTEQRVAQWFEYTLHKSLVKPRG